MLRVAVIEDNEDNRLVLEVFLQGLYDLVMYEDGIQGLAGLRQDRPDLLLLDMSLPDMDGLEVLHHIHNDPTLRDLPVIAVTAHAMRGDRERFLAAGFDDYVSKPIVDETVLLMAMARLLETAGCHLTGTKP
jgi:CheY-like chemotaxis protein